MSNRNGRRTHTRGTAAVSGRGAARQRAYDLVIDAQITNRDARTQASELTHHARGAGWHDVCAIADYAVAVMGWRHTTQQPATSRHIDTFVRWAQRTGDAFALALALCARASDPHHLDGQASQVDDLIHAYEAAELVRRTVDRAFALHEIAGRLHELRLWELATEIYGEVERLSSGLRSPAALVGAFAANRYYTLACELLHAREAGDIDEVRRRADRVDAVAAAPLNPAIPEEWRRSVAGYAAICHVLADHSGADTIVALLDGDPGTGVDGHEITALLRCVLGWHHLEHGRWERAEPLIVDGARVIGEGTDAAFRSFALWLLARLRNRWTDPAGRAAGQRYVSELIRARDESRDALVRSVHARLQTGRLRAERDRFARESLTDSLTGLANRRALETHLQTVSASTMLIMIDIDQFKPVNDRFGHGVGDEVLRRIGQILLDCIRPGDLAARLGGDEFMLVLDAADRDVAIRRGHEVCDRIRSEPWHHLSDGLRVAASIGVAWGARDGLSLYREADDGLYEAKRAGGACVRGGSIDQLGGARRT